MTIERFPVESGLALLFARAIGDGSSAFEQDPGDAVVPPTFVQASAHFDPDYPLRPRPGMPWFGSASAPSQSAANEATAPALPGGQAGDAGMASVLHAEQHYTYHGAVRIGDVLTAATRPGESWEREGRRGGTLRFIETITEFRNQRGELVVTVRSVGVSTSNVVAPA